MAGRPSGGLCADKSALRQKSSTTFTNVEGKQEEEDLIYNR